MMIDLPPMPVQEAEVVVAKARDIEPGPFNLFGPSAGNHHTHYHVDFRPPGGPVVIESSRRLESATTASNNPQSISTDFAANLQGEEMLKTLSAAALALAFAGSPAAATQPPTIEPSQVNAKNIGSCEIYDPNDLYLAGNALRPIGAIYAYVQSHQKSHLTELELTDFSVRYLEQPSYGIIKAVPNENGTLEFYIPNSGYAGNDRYVAEVAVKGVKFRVVGYIRPSNDVMSSFGVVCRRLGLPSTAWKISDATDSNPGYEPLTMPASLAAALGDLDLQMADLAGSAVGNTVGTGPSAQITLDTNAAGHGWFIDPTPADNTEFLPTSNPNEWIAKEGSEAYGKMDLLSVLLHEYGHALGLEHSTDAHDFMATTLQPGVRRTLTVDEQLALMQLAGFFPTPDSPSAPYGPTDPGAPLPFTRVLSNARNARLRREGGLDALVPQFDTVANPKLTNPEFAGAQGWATTGDVASEGFPARLLRASLAFGHNARFLYFFLSLSLLCPPAFAETVKILVQSSPLAGSQYYAVSEVWPQIKPGDRLTLSREPENRHDRNAIRVDWNGRQLGYVPRAENRAVAAALDRGEKLEARVSKLREANDPWQRVEFEVYLVL